MANKPNILSNELDQAQKAQKVGYKKVIQSSKENIIKSMEKGIEKMDELLEKNKNWKNENPTTSGDKNPYPNKIQMTFIKYYKKHYNTIISYETEENGRVSITADNDDIENATIHAWFDCTTIKECFNTLKYWITDYQNIYLEEDNLHLVGDVEVKSVEKK